MKKITLLLVGMVIALSMRGATPNDTIVINQNDVSKWIEAPSVNTKGEKTVKYYCIYKGLLLTTSKYVKEKAELCAKYGAKCSLICIGKKVHGVFVPKRIAMN